METYFAMKNFYQLKFTILALLFLLYHQNILAKRCTGSSNCTACSSCNFCKHCNGGGGSCGVCGGGDENNYTTSKSDNKIHWGRWIIAGIIIFIIIKLNTPPNKKTE